MKKSKTCADGVDGVSRRGAIKVAGILGAPLVGGASYVTNTEANTLGSIGQKSKTNSYNPPIPSKLIGSSYKGNTYPFTNGLFKDINSLKASAEKQKALDYIEGEKTTIQTWVKPRGKNSTAEFGFTDHNSNGLGFRVVLHSEESEIECLQNETDGDALYKISIYLNHKVKANEWHRIKITPLDEYYMVEIYGPKGRTLCINRVESLDSTDSKKLGVLRKAEVGMVNFTKVLGESIEDSVYELRSSHGKIIKNNTYTETTKRDSTKAKLISEITFSDDEKAEYVGYLFSDNSLMYMGPMNGVFYGVINNRYIEKSKEKIQKIRNEMFEGGEK